MEQLPFRQIHLDFHTSEQIVQVGERFDAEEFARSLAAAHVNSINCFAKCHHGMLYYDTRFPARHPGLKINLLGEQIAACHRHGIKVPTYISVGLDEYSAREHPDWVEIGPDGRRHGAPPLQAGWKKMCLNNPEYVQYVAEQTQEVLETLDGDGIWYDIISQGECCCRYCLEGMQAAGLDPEQSDDRKQFAAQVLVNLKRRLTALVWGLRPGTLIFWNAGHVGPNIRASLDCYSHLELESLGSGGWGYHHFPITVRFARQLGMEYLGMTGKFHKSWADFGGFKTPEALEFECFNMLATGAKCCVGDQLHPSGQITPATYDLIGAVYQSVEAKEPWCEGARPVTEIGVFTPELLETVPHGSITIDDSLHGAYRMLIESHQQFDVLDDQCDLTPYRVLILPDKITLTPEFARKLEAYVAGGGSLILSHRSGTREGSDEFALSGVGARILGEAEYSPDFVVAGPSIAQGILPSEHVMYERGLALEPAGGEALAEVWNPYFNRTYRHFCSHFHTPVEKPSGRPAIVKSGRIIYFAHPIFGLYQRHGARVYKQLFLNCLDLLLPEKLLTTNAPTTAHLTVNRQPHKERTVVHILHYIPERRANGIDTIEDAIPLYHVQLNLRLPKPPRRAYLAPQGAELACTYQDGVARVTVPEVVGHQMVVFED